jgi:hypothetical protein
MPSADEQGGESVVMTTLSAQVHEEILLLGRSESAADDDDIEVIEYEVSLNSLHRAIHVVHGDDPQPGEL